METDTHPGRTSWRCKHRSGCRLYEPRNTGVAGNRWILEGPSRGGFSTVSGRTRHVNSFLSDFGPLKLRANTFLFCFYNPPNLRYCVGSSRKLCANSANRNPFSLFPLSRCWVKGMPPICSGHISALVNISVLVHSETLDQAPFE